MKYLIDASVANRVIRKQVEPWVEDLIADGQVAICEPVLREVMRVARKREYLRLQAHVHDAYEWLPVPASVWDYVRAMADDLAGQSMQRMFSVTDFVVAALAIHFKLTVLHNDKDFVVAAELFPQLEELRVPEIGIAREDT